MRRFSLTSAILLIFIIKVYSQFGGSSTYDFLNLTSSARVNALGGTQVGIIDSTELSLSFYNPAVLMPSAHNYLSINYIRYISDINIGYVSYARKIDKIGTFAAGIHYVNYGKFAEALENGTLTGSNFSAADYALNLIYSRNIWRNFTAGINIKPIYSAYETYKSFGVAADLGISYIDSAGLFSCGLVFKNMGSQITAYQVIEKEYEPLPFDIQLGFSQRLAHAPFRFDITLDQLHKWNLTDKSTWDFDHKDSTDTNVSGSSDDIVRQFMRHVILGVEFIPSKNFCLYLGYNYQRKRELSVSNTSNELGLLANAAGLSGGFGVKISKFRLSYAIAKYHLSGTTNTFSVSFNLSEFR